MSDEKDPDPDTNLGEPETPEPRDSGGAKVDTDDDELDELEGDGFDRAVAQARDRVGTRAGLTRPGDRAEGDLDPDLGERPYTREEAGLRGRVGWGRSPIISVAVIIVGLFLLSATWSDFRYFLRSTQSQPRELGHVGDIYQDGEFTERFDDEWVVLEGQPDVQHAARMPGRDGWIGFMRLVEGDASMFVAIPRETEDATNEFPGRFEGRMRRLDDAPQWEKLQTFFNAEQIVDIINLAPDSVIAAVAAGSGSVELADTSAGASGSIDLAATDKLRLVVSQPVAMAQLGRSTWPTRADAEAAIVALGRPWVFIEKRDTSWVFAVEVGPKAGVEIHQELTRALNGGRDLADPDPKVGGLVLPRRTTYLVEFGDLQVEGAALSFTYGDNSAETGWRREGDKLVPIELVSGRLAVPSASIEAIRVESALKADPDGYLLLVDHEPFDAWPSALMFVAVLGVVLLNGWALATTLRRRRTGPAAAG